MKVLNHSTAPVYTVAGSSNARALPEWLIRKRKRSLKNDPEFANRVDLLQDFEFEEASSCIRVSEDGNWIMSTGTAPHKVHLTVALESTQEQATSHYYSFLCCRDIDDRLTWVTLSIGTYKPQIHTHYLPHLSLSFARHTDALNQKFLLFSSDYSKSLHLQTDRFLEFHTPGGRHYSTRIPRYGRDLKFNRRTAEALVPCVGVNTDGSGEVFRLNLEIGRFMKAYEVDVGGDDATSIGYGTIQGGLDAGSVNTAAVAEESHNLLAFGTSLGTVEFWDARSRCRIGILAPPERAANSGEDTFEISALEFHFSGLSLTTGSSTGLIHLYDLRNPRPLLKKDQGYGYPIQNLMFLHSAYSKRADTSDPKVLSADKRIIKIWDQHDGTPWTAVEPDVDLNDVAWYPDSGMLLTANEGRQQHAFFIPQLGPAPRWCAFLDNIVEEMAEDPDDPHAFGAQKAGQVYDNYKFLTTDQLQALNLDHLVGRTGLLRPYMHGYFVAQKLYEEARLISNPELWQEQRQKSIKQKVEKERESRIRGNKKVSVKVNKRLVERMIERDEKNERRKAKRMQAKTAEPNNGNAEDAAAATRMDADTNTNGDENATANDVDGVNGRKKSLPTGKALLQDERFASLFQDDDFEVDETSKEFQALNPSTQPWRNDYHARKMAAAEQEEDEEGEEYGNGHASNSDDTSSASDEPVTKSQSKSLTTGQKRNKDSPKQHRRPQHAKTPSMRVSSSSSFAARQLAQKQDLTFGARVADAERGGMSGSMGDTTGEGLSNGRGGGDSRRGGGGGVGEKIVTFAPTKKAKRSSSPARDDSVQGRQRQRGKKDRRSASGNTFRRM